MDAEASPALPLIINCHNLVYTMYMDINTTSHSGVQLGSKGGKEEVQTQRLFREEMLLTGFSLSEDPNPRS